MATLSIDIALISIAWTSVTSAGAVTVTGLKVGDVVLALNKDGDNVSHVASGWYENVISVDDQIQQLTGGLGGATFTAALYRAG